MSHFGQIVFLLVTLLFGPSAPEKTFRVYVFMEESCKICQYYSPELIRLHDKYGSEVEFVGLFPNPGSDETTIEKYKEDYRLPFQLEKDLGQLMANKLGATITPEVFLVELKSQRIIYQGRIDNSYVRVGKRRTVVTAKDLDVALENRSNPDALESGKSKAIGCFIMKQRS